MLLYTIYLAVFFSSPQIQACVTITQFIATAMLDLDGLQTHLVTLTFMGVASKLMHSLFTNPLPVLLEV